MFSEHIWTYLTFYQWIHSYQVLEATSICCTSVHIAYEHTFAYKLDGMKIENPFNDVVMQQDAICGCQ